MTGTTETMLFDRLGPRGRRRMRQATVGAVVLVVAVVGGLVAQLAHTGQFDAWRWAPFSQPEFLGFLGSGLVVTLEVGLTGSVLSFVLGTLLGLGRAGRNRVVSTACAAVIEFFRAMPLLLLVFFFLIGLPSMGLVLPPFWQITCAIVLHAGAVFAEIVRAGVLSLDRGQFEAASALGMRHGQSMRLVVLPQVFRTLRPALVTQLIRTLKESSLGYVVSLPELLHNGKVLGEYTGSFLQAYAVTAAVYIVINYCLSLVADRLDRRRPTVDRGTPKPDDPALEAGGVPMAAAR